MRGLGKAVTCAVVALALCLQQAVSFTSVPAPTPGRICPLLLRRRGHVQGAGPAARTPSRFLTALQGKKGAGGRKKVDLKDPIHANTRVLVVGGGIGGLAAALALARRGFQVQVLEKDASFSTRRQGYGLTLQQGGAALSRLGVAEAVASASSWSASHFVFDSLGAIVAFWGPTWWKRARELRERRHGSEGGERVEEEEDGTGAGRHASSEKEGWRKLAGHNLHIPRQALREILLHALLAEQPDAVSWGAHVARVAEVGAAGAEEEEEVRGSEDAVEAGRHVVVEAEDGRRFVGHCCIACDGIHSSMRRLLLPDSAPLQYLGHIVVLGIFATAAFPLAQRRAWQMSDGAARIYGQPYTADLAMWQLSWPMEEQAAVELSRSPSRLRQAALAKCKAWCAPIPDMIAASDFEHLVSGFPAYDRPPARADDLRVSPALGGDGALWTLAGDAVHPMSPFKGQGANQALLDGLCVSEALHRYLSLNQRRWMPDADRGGEHGALRRPDTRRPASFPGGSEREWESMRMALALRDYERVMCARAAPKVEQSHASVAEVHDAAFTEPQFHVKRKGMALQHILELRALGVCVAAAAVAPEHLEQLAFSHALTGSSPTSDHDDT